MNLGKKIGAIAAGVGGGGGVGAVIGAGIGLASTFGAIAATLPFAAAGAMIGGLTVA